MYQQTLDLDIGRLLRDEGAAAAFDNAGWGWKGRATALVLEFFAGIGAQGALFEEAREYAHASGLDSPPSANAWGALCLVLSKRGVIEKTGRLMPSRSARSHARSQPAWVLSDAYRRELGDDTVSAVLDPERSFCPA